jgi:C-terminal processing protease CtpA/Prc
MDSPSFRTVFDKMLGKYRNREAIIVDTRWNGGGWLHNDLAILLGGKEYVRFVPRGNYIGSEPFSQWTKPSVMLVNESNYSDAHGSPFVYQTLGLGDVVGAPVPGTMTAVWWEKQIDPTLVFGIPQVTSIDMHGNVLENHQLNPDVLIYNRPDDVMNGKDAQIEGSVRTLLEKLDKNK